MLAIREGNPQPESRLSLASKAVTVILNFRFLRDCMGRRVSATGDPA